MTCVKVVVDTLPRRSAVGSGADGPDVRAAETRAGPDTTLLSTAAVNSVVREYGFELALCAHLEGGEELVGRQLGAAVTGRRIVDVVLVERGPAFRDRAAITADTIPGPAIESDVGPGTARYWKDAFDCHPERAQSVVDRAVDLGFFETERHNGRQYVRQTARYPEDWFDRLVGIENKPDLDRPGALEDQLRTDVSLAAFDEVVLATESYVTRAHLNRLPEAVGVWRFDPDTGEREVVRAATPLDSAGPGVELLDRQPARVDVRVVNGGEKRRLRRTVAERAYGKGWRTYDLPACANCQPDAAEPVDAGLPRCTYYDRLVHPAEECGPACPGHEPAASPEIDLEAVRDERTRWERDPDGVTRRQTGLDRFRG
jgi:hypothetical protein